MGVCASWSPHKAWACSGRWVACIPRPQPSAVISAPCAHGRAQGRVHGRGRQAGGGGWLLRWVYVRAGPLIRPGHALGGGWHASLDLNRALSSVHRVGTAVRRGECTGGAGNLVEEGRLRQPEIQNPKGKVETARADADSEQISTIMECKE